MHLPFTIDQFFDVFRQYNEAVWPAPVILASLAVLCVLLVVRPQPWTSRFVSGVLAVLWVWVAFAYHLAFFARINVLAYAFAAVSVAGAGLFLWFGVVRHTMVFASQNRNPTVAGMVLAIYALLVYPMLSNLTGHHYPGMPTFGLPCPTTIFTIGMLAFLERPMPRMVFAAPLLWCVVGVQGAFLLGVTQDLGLAAAAAIGVWVMFGRASKVHNFVASNADRRTSVILRHR